MTKETMHLAVTAVLGITTCVLGGTAYKYQKEAEQKERLLKTVVSIKAPALSVGAVTVLPIPTIDSGSEKAVLTPVLNPYQQEIAQHRARTNAEPWLRIIAEKDSQYAVLKRYTASLQKGVPEGVDPALVRLMRDTINSQRRQLAIARSIPTLFKDRNVSVPVFLPALDGDTTHPLIDLAGLRFNTELSLMDSTYQRNPFYEKQYYTVLKTEDIARATISGKGSLVLKREQPKLGFRIQALTTYSIWRRSFSVGIGTRVDYGNRFNAGFNAIINPFTGIPEISIYAKEDIAQWGR